MKLKVDKKNEYIIGVLGPRYKGNYALILPAVIKSVDQVRFAAEKELNLNSDEEEPIEHEKLKQTFVFVHDGVSSGSTGEVIESINKTQQSLRGYGINVTVRKKPLDIELHGKQAHYRWIDELLELDLDLLVLFDNQEWHQVRYAQTLASEKEVPLYVVPINPEKEK